jgi:C1A family cysteine protease
MLKIISLIVLIVILSLTFGSETYVFPKTWKEFEVSDKKSINDLFQVYKKTFNKKYDSLNDESVKFQIFSDRVFSIFDFNEKKDRTYTKGITFFTDLSKKDRESYVQPERKVDDVRIKSSGSKKDSVTSSPISKALNGAGDETNCDLRPFTTPVKNQGQCGSCWAFGTIAAAEASHFLWSMSDTLGNAPLNSDSAAWQLSEQVLVNCCDAYDANGCGGGGTSGPMQCAVDMGALPSTTSQPYSAMDNETCSHSDSQAAGYVQSWYEPCNLDEVCLKSYIGGNTCTEFFTTAMKTSIEVVDSFYDYIDGVYSEPGCPNTIHNHAVAIVGWGTLDDVDYWIVRNSWGPDWGNQGYIYIERGVNMCCIACENLFFQ